MGGWEGGRVGRWEGGREEGREGGREVDVWRSGASACDEFHRTLVVQVTELANLEGNFFLPSLQFLDCAQIGRDLVRLLQGVARYI